MCILIWNKQVSIKPMTLNKLSIQWPSSDPGFSYWTPRDSVTKPHLMSQSAGPRWQSLSRQSQNGTDLTAPSAHWHCRKNSALQSETWSKLKQETQKWSQASCHFATVVLSGIKSTPTVCLQQISHKEVGLNGALKYLNWSDQRSAI